MATATIKAPAPELVRLDAEMNKRGISKRRIALRLSYLKHYPDRIYKIFDGTRPMPANFIEHVCGLTGIPQRAVFSPEDAYALRQYLDDVAYEENLQRMGNGY